jgi:hypothetical protein
MLRMVTQQAIDAIRALDESDLTHSHWHFHWEEEGSDWLVETVKNDRGEEWPVKQLISRIRWRRTPLLVEPHGGCCGRAG